MLGCFLPNLSKRIGLTITPKESTTFYLNLVSQIIMQTLIELKNENVTIEQLTAQAYLFFLARFETTARTIAFALFELAQDEVIQDNLRTSINWVLANHGGNLTYETVQ